jgi:protein involved in polysaccharide export with SLBB domain
MTLISMKSSTSKLWMGVTIAFFGIVCTPLVAQRESVVIGPGDLVHVQVFDTPEMTTATLRCCSSARLRWVARRRNRQRRQ